MGTSSQKIPYTKKRISADVKQLNVEILDPYSQPPLLRGSGSSRCILEEPVNWADGFLVVYDISDQMPFLHAKKILRQIKEARKESIRVRISAACWESGATFDWGCSTGRRRNIPMWSRVLLCSISESLFSGAESVDPGSVEVNTLISQLNNFRMIYIQEDFCRINAPPLERGQLAKSIVTAPHLFYWLYKPYSIFYDRLVDLSVFLVGNKQKLCNARQVCEEEGHCLAQEDLCLFQKVSAAKDFTKLIHHGIHNHKYSADRRQHSGSKSMPKAEVCLTEEVCGY